MIQMINITLPACTAKRSDHVTSQSLQCKRNLQGSLGKAFAFIICIHDSTGPALSPSSCLSCEYGEVDMNAGEG
jgi:hypothetical protein